MEEQLGHGSPDCAELTGGPGYEDQSVIGHTISGSFVEFLVAYTVYKGLIVWA